MGFFLAALREVADAFQVAYDAGHVVHIFAVADGAFMEIPFVDMATVVADSIGNIESEIIATLGSCHPQQLAILFLGKVLV